MRSDRKEPRIWIDKRGVLGGAAAGAALLAPGAELAQGGDAERLKRAIGRGHDLSVQRLRDWIALPSIAAEDRDMERGCARMMELARDAGFARVQCVPTAGAPSVFGVMDNGAKRTLGLYFMYDVKQFDAAEWSSPPLEGQIVEWPGLGRMMLGRGATNQKG